MTSHNPVEESAFTSGVAPIPVVITLTLLVDSTSIGRATPRDSKANQQTITRSYFEWAGIDGSCPSPEGEHVGQFAQVLAKRGYAEMPHFCLHEV